MISLLLLLIPLVTGLITFLLSSEKIAKLFTIASALATLLVSIIALNSAATHFEATWLPTLGSKFILSMDGMGKMLTLLTAIAFPLVLIGTSNNSYKNANAFYALMLLAQAGLIGVFLAADCLVFYFFWELALIPVYFLCSIWGGEKRIQVTFKFFIYTFIGSLLMLVGILYVYHLNPAQSFSLDSLYALKLTAKQQATVFALFFIAFAIKMPIFPFHTWQPDAYEQSPTATTMIMSGVMVKMGIFAVVKWLLPITPLAVAAHSNLVIVLCVIGMIYASLIAIKQDSIKKVIAYSSIAHIGLMCAAIFTTNQAGLQGVMIQMFNHGVNVIGLWIVANLIEQQLGYKKLSELGGLAQQAPTTTILFVIMALANVALPLTNAFVGEFLMFNGLFKFSVLYTVLSGICIILAAVYTLNLVQKIFYGTPHSADVQLKDADAGTRVSLVILTGLIFVFGVYPQPLIELTKDTVAFLIK